MISCNIRGRAVEVTAIPLERTPEEVEADLASGYISAARALDVYGVVPGEDSVKTELRREQIRRRRLTNANPPTQGSAVDQKRGDALSDVSLYPDGQGSTVDQKKGVALSRFGAGLVLAQTEKEELQFECECGHVFCGAGDNWKDHAACYSLEEDELPSGIRLHETMELVGYLCPDCGRQHSLDVKERGVAPLHDLKITRWVNQEKHT